MRGCEDGFGFGVLAALRPSMLAPHGLEPKSFGSGSRAEPFCAVNTTWPQRQLLTSIHVYVLMCVHVSCAAPIIDRNCVPAYSRVWLIVVVGANPRASRLGFETSFRALETQASLHVLCACMLKASLPPPPPPHTHTHLSGSGRPWPR
jgi:hypothetical protein